MPSAGSCGFEADAIASSDASRLSRFAQSATADPHRLAPDRQEHRRYARGRDPLDRIEREVAQA